MTNRQARALLHDSASLQTRADAAARDLLTDPRWEPWEGVADYEEGPATLIDARDVSVVLFRAGPERGACVAAWCLLVVGLLVVAGGLWEWLR